MLDVCYTQTVQAEVEDELRELKREVIESRGLVIKTNNLTNALSADLKSIAKRQAGYERRISWNSGSAYVVFVLVILLGVKVLWDYRIDNMASHSQDNKGEVDALRNKVKELERRDESRAKRDNKAVALYELVRANKRTELLDQLDAPTKETLSKAELAFLQDAAERYRNELALERYTAGLEHVRLARWQEAATAFEESIKIKSDASTAPSCRLTLAQTYRQLKRLRDAIPILQALSESATDKEMQALSMYELAVVEEEILAWNDAKATLRAFLKKFPDHARANDARIRIADLVAKH